MAATTLNLNISSLSLNPAQEKQQNEQRIKRLMGDISSSVINALYQGAKTTLSNNGLSGEITIEFVSNLNNDLISESSFEEGRIQILSKCTDVQAISQIGVELIRFIKKPEFMNIFKNIRNIPCEEFVGKTLKIVFESMQLHHELMKRAIMEKNWSQELDKYKDVEDVEKDFFIYWNKNKASVASESFRNWHREEQMEKEREMQMEKRTERLLTRVGSLNSYKELCALATKNLIDKKLIIEFISNNMSKDLIEPDFSRRIIYISASSNDEEELRALVLGLIRFSTLSKYLQLYKKVSISKIEYEIFFKEYSQIAFEATKFYHNTMGKIFKEMGLKYLGGENYEKLNFTEFFESSKMDSENENYKKLYKQLIEKSLQEEKEQTVFGPSESKSEKI
jgi:hypothetical protein